MKPSQKVQAARYALMKQRPYLATATIRLRMVASEACPHALAASEGWVLYYNPDLVEQTELETLVIQLRREVERLIRRHARRLKSLPREVAETASAMEIDDDLAGEYGSRPDWTLPQQMGLEPGRTAEEYALALLDMLSQSQGSPSCDSQDGESQDGDDSDAGSSGAVADSSSDEESDGRDGASADGAPTPSAKQIEQIDSSANAPDSSQGAGAPAGGDGEDPSPNGASDRSRGDSSPQQPQDANAGDSSQSGGASGADGACDAQRPSDQTGDDDARDSDPATESSQQGSAASGRPAPWETEEEPVSEVEIDQLIELTLRAAAEYAKTRGGQGLNMARRYESAAKNKPLPWQRILARYIAQGRVYGAGRLDYSYSRPHRRQSVVQDVVLPTLRQPMLDIAVIVDTSGSIDDGELGLALREVQAILKRGGVAEMRVVFGDTRIRAEARVRTVSEAVKAFRRMRGGGGTDMGHLVREVAQGAKNPKSRPQSRPPQLVVVITDGETPWGAPPRTRVPVIAVITPRGRRNNTPAWVKEVVIDV
jgi:predicted metal-dependent peptidase